jgi:uncharacterized cupredoxin-like copper-binding protein
MFTGVFGILLAVGVLAGMLAFSANAQPQDSSATTTITVLAGKPSEFQFKLSKTTKIPVGTVKFVVTNAGHTPHSFEICKSPKGTSKPNSCVGTKTKILNPGQKQTIVVKLVKGTYEFLCTVPGHAAAGMKGVIGVGTAAPPTSSSTSTTSTTPGKSTSTSQQNGVCNSPQTQTIQVNEFDYGYNLPSTIHCGTVTFVVTNTGQLQHNLNLLGIPGAITDIAGPGDPPLSFTAKLYVGTVQYQCDYPEHASLGMYGSFTVVD